MRATREGATPGAGRRLQRQPQALERTALCNRRRPSESKRPRHPRQRKGQPWPARRDPEARASRGRAWWGREASPKHPPPAFPGRRCNGIPPIPRKSAAGLCTRLLPALRFALPPPTLPTLHAAPRAGVGVPVRLRAPPRPSRAPPRPPRTYRSGPPAPHLPARTCRGARSLAAGGRGSGGKRPVAVATAPGGACAEQRGAERGSRETARGAPPAGWKRHYATVTAKAPTVCPAVG